MIQVLPLNHESGESDEEMVRVSQYVYPRLDQSKMLVYEIRYSTISNKLQPLVVRTEEIK